jgi:hypothetical protein
MHTNLCERWTVEMYVRSSFLSVAKVEMIPLQCDNMYAAKVTGVEQ